MFDKTLKPRSVPTMFSTEHSKPHSHRKRLLTHLYSKSTLQSSPTMRAISNRIIFQRFLPKFVQAEGGPVDVLFLINCVAMDFVTAYLFGMCNGTNFLRDEDLARHWLHCFHSRRPFVFWTGELPAIISWCNLLGPANPLSTPFVVEANRWLGDHCLRMVDDVLDTQPDATAELAHPENIPVVTRHLHSSLRRQADKSDAIPLTGSQHSIRMQVASEVLDHLMAGFETTGITLTYLFWELAQRPTLQRKLRDELRGIFSPLYTSFDSDAAKLPDSKTIDSLPLLHAILMETLRLHPAIPGPEPRMTPPDATVGGIPHLPAGVRVSCSAYSLHKNPDVFPDPLEFRPDRWISAAADGAAGKERMAEQHRWFWAFSSGGRMCIGSNLAVQEMKLLVASIVSGWRAEMVNDEGIEQEDAYTAQPTSKKLLLKFARW